MKTKRLLAALISIFAVISSYQLMADDTPQSISLDKLTLVAEETPAVNRLNPDDNVLSAYYRYYNYYSYYRPYYSYYNYYSYYRPYYSYYNYYNYYRYYNYYYYRYYWGAAPNSGQPGELPQPRSNLD